MPGVGRFHIRESEVRVEEEAANNAMHPTANGAGLIRETLCLIR
jgi:hypothetical protein